MHPDPAHVSIHTVSDNTKRQSQSCNMSCRCHVSTATTLPSLPVLCSAVQPCWPAATSCGGACPARRYDPGSSWWHTVVMSPATSGSRMPKTLLPLLLMPMLPPLAPLPLPAVLPLVPPAAAAPSPLPVPRPPLSLPALMTTAELAVQSGGGCCWVPRLWPGPSCWAARASVGRCCCGLPP